MASSIGKNVDPSTTAMNAFQISFGIVVSMIQCAVVVSAASKMQTAPGKVPVDWRLKALFFSAFMCAFVPTISDVVGNVLDEFGNGYPMATNLVVCVAGPSYFFVILLGTLVFRLHIIFKDTTFRMSRAMYIVFSLILSAIFIGATVDVILLEIWIHLDTDSVNVELDLDLVIITVCCLYVIGSVLAVALLLNNLSKLAQEQASTIRSDNMPKSPSKIDLNKNQMQITDLAARYLGLFVIANFSTIVLSLFSVMIDTESGLHFRLVTIAITVNLICVYLQFGSAQNHYHRLCGCCDKGFQRITRRRTQTMVYRSINNSFGVPCPVPTMHMAVPSESTV